MPAGRPALTSAAGFVYDPLCLEHDAGDHPESPERLRAIVGLLESSGLLARLLPIPARDATVGDLTLVHAREHVERVRDMAASGGRWADPDTWVGPRSYDAAVRAVGGVLAAVDAVIDGDVRSAFCALRPPGHHATPDRAMGFCLFNQVAVAAGHLVVRRGLERVAILDFDVHHGNGTQDAFYRRGDVLYVSTHQYPFYPGTGHYRETGEGPGEGATVNLPLPRGARDGDIRRVVEEVAAPVVRRFRPQFVLVSAGYDAHYADPLAGLELSVDGYGWLMATAKALADELCDGRLVCVLEGGYHLTALPWGVRRTIETLLGVEPAPDPLGPLSPDTRFDLSELVATYRETHGL
ncbi:MAG TPA: histone deacetylase [Dehalococcoidia bacterium]|nr:histone deacetylase [Dehalococcoidia bacterium]